jgi:adenylate cyclase
MSSAADLPEQPPDLSALAADPRKLAAFVHADVVAYSALVGQDDAGTSAMLADIRRTLIDPALSRFGGRVVNTAGDSLLMEFGSVMSAVRCAFELQSAIPDFDDGRPPDRRIRFRMGVNIGDAITEGSNLHGDGVNIAARLQAICPPGDLCVSRAVRDEIRGRLGFTFEALGAQELRNIARPVEAFVIRVSPDAVPSEPPNRSRRAVMGRRGPLAMLALVLALGAATGLWQWWVRQGTRPALISTVATADASPALSIAVLPFDNLSSDPEQGYLAAGISEDLTTDLSHLEGSFVIARESAFSFRGRESDVREIGQQLGVRYVLEGSVRKLGETVRINAQLVSTDTGAHLWAERFDESIHDLAAGQDAIVGRIGTALGTRLVARKAAGARAAGASQTQAYDLVLRARAVLQEPPSSGRIIIAAGLFEQALRLDRNSVPALAGEAIMLLQGRLGYRFIDRASQLIAAAEQLDAAGHVIPGSPDVLAAKFLLQRRTGRLDESVTTFGTLLDVDSSAAGLAAQLQPWEYWDWPGLGIPLLERILHLNPRSSAAHILTADLGRELLLAGRNDEAISMLERAMSTPPQVEPTASDIDQAAWSSAQVDRTLLFLASAYAWADRPVDAKTMLDRVLASPAEMDLTVRSVMARIPRFDDPARIAQRRHFADGLRRAGLRDHLDEDADGGVFSDGTLREFERLNSPTPMTVPGGTTIRTADLEKLLADRKPVILSTASDNPSLPGAVFIGQFNSGSLDDVWEARLERMLRELTFGDMQKPIVTFAYSINHWQSRNLAIRLIALGYKEVYWYRGGWEAWSAHNLPLSPVVMQLR